MASAPQENSGRETNATQGNSKAMFHVPEDNLAHTGGASLSARNKGKKRQRASSGGVQGITLNARGPKVAGAVHRAKGKQAETEGSWDANPSPQKKSWTNPTKKVEIRRQSYICSLEFPFTTLLMTYAAR